MVGLILAVGFAVVGRGDGEGPATDGATDGATERTRPSASDPAGNVAAGSTAPATNGSGEVSHVIILEEPTTDFAVVRTVDLVIRGRRTDRPGPVRVMLESSPGRPISVTTIEPRILPWARDPEPGFHLELPLSNPRPNGTMVLHVVAYDSAGVPVDVVRRFVRIGAIAESLAGGRSTHESGTDGLLGGIVFRSLARDSEPDAANDRPAPWSLSGPRRHPAR